MSSRTAVYLVAIIAAFSAPLVEEVIYRGVLYPAIENGALKIVRLQTLDTTGLQTNIVRATEKTCGAEVNFGATKPFI